jgi:hypothetical protein
MYSRWRVLRLLVVTGALLSGVACHADRAAPAGARAPGVNPLDFSGVWETISMDRVVMPESDQTPYTDAVRQANAEYAARYDPVQDDPARFCLWKGMPYTMLIRARNYPVEIFQTDQRIVMFFELYDMYRDIHLNATGVPDTYPPTANGYSYARWEPDALVIETGGLLALHRIGQVHRSEDAHIVERWSFKQDPRFGQVLNVDMTITDPGVYTAPVHVHNEWKRSAPGTVVGGYNCTNTLWADHIKEHEARPQGRKGAG